MRIAPPLSSIAPVSISARHNSHSRKALPSVSACNARRERVRPGASRAAHEIVDLVVRERGQPHPHDVVAAQVGQRLGERVGDVRVRVAERGEQQQPRPARAREMSQEQQRGRVGPVAVLEHEQCRAPPRDAGQQVDDRGVQAVTLRVGVGVPSRRGLAEVGEQASQFTRSGRERRAQLVRVERADQLVERLDERPVRGANHGVGGAVEDQHARVGGLGGELAREPALAGPRLTAEQDDSPLLAVRSREQRPQTLELR